MQKNKLISSENRLTFCYRVCTCFDEEVLRGVHLDVDEVVSDVQIKFLSNLEVVVINPLAHPLFVQTLSFLQENEDENVEVEKDLLQKVGQLGGACLVVSPQN